MLLARPRIVEVTGAAITLLRWRPMGSRVSTMTGRTLSSCANQTWPRHGSGVITVPNLCGVCATLFSMHIVEFNTVLRNPFK